MNARVTEPKAGEATVVSMPRAEKGAPQAAAPAEAAAPAAPPKKRSNRLVLMIAVPLVLAVGGGYFWLTGGRYEDTDNAFVQQAKVALSADIAGRIASVSVTENEAVKAGQVLFTIDAEPYRIALDQANAALASARVGVEQLKVGYGTAQATLRAAQSTLDIRQAAFDRKTALVQQGNASDATLDDVRLALEQAQNAVVAAQQQVAGATAALGGDPAIATDDHPAVRAAQAAVDVAERNLGKTTVLAPADGVVSQVASLNVGQFVATGTMIASLVETSGSWVEANFKETQLTDIKTGMPAEVSVDAFPGVKLEGTVASIGAATGSEFSLIPAQNATGTWVKVVQRIPVRIDLADASKALLLRTGMSAAVNVDTGRSTLDKLLNR
ncbi:MAG: HlyD family secretion protein [Devosia nanyangense]|uniref:HlyD family secretion protein n=1 Tax=Devosia nanyangense TaxID=1228055 RepID=A0A933KZH8_9HYPH|nr:HlyD family secretion protein [Devosia nanyangense]